MTIWYTADTHFGHENIMRFCNRPFMSTSHMDAAMLENMWKLVSPEDHLWILGDFAFGSKAKDSVYVEQMFNQLPGAERHLVVGNHDLR
ncbi:MAG: metallophosphoesterase, partial [Lentilitoribacter sp.]